MEYILKDIHSHVLPCVDDGSDSMKKSIALVKNMSSCGTKELVLTPHYSVRRRYRTRKDKILSCFDEFKNAVMENGINIKLHLGCEIEYSSDVPRLLNEGKVLTLCNSKYILLEFAPYISIRDMINAVQDIVLLGYIPVLAHIERYSALRNNIDDVIQLRNIGAKIQVNIDYITSKMIFTDIFLKLLISMQLIDFVAGDIHVNAYSPSQIKKCAKIIQKYSSSDYVQEVFYKNAEKILTTNEEKK